MKRDFKEKRNNFLKNCLTKKSKQGEQMHDSIFISTCQIFMLTCQLYVDL